MIKILKNTMIDPIEKTCKNCGSIFTFNYEDIQRREENSFIGFTRTDIFVVCPVCKASLSLGSSNQIVLKESEPSLKKMSEVVDKIIDEV